MKRLINILLTTACAAVLFSCTHEYAFKTTSYVIVEQTNIAVKEDAGLVRIPVSAFNSASLTGSVYFKVIDGTAVQGTDFTVEPANGVLTFNGNSTEYIQISVIEHPGVLTGALKFSVELTSVSGDITDLGGIKTCNVEIQDNDVVVDWDFVVGEWKADDFGLQSYKLTIAKTGDNALTITNLFAGGKTINATIEFNVSENTATIAIPVGQVVDVDSTYGPLYICGGIPGEYNLEFAYGLANSNGITIGPWTPRILEGTYAGYYFTGYYGYSVLTK